jgi:hypothetical protein
MPRWYWQKLEGHFQEDVELEIIFGVQWVAGIAQEKRERGAYKPGEVESVKRWLHLIFSDPVMSQVKERSSKTIKRYVANLEGLYISLNEPKQTKPVARPVAIRKRSKKKGKAFDREVSRAVWLLSKGIKPDTVARGIIHGRDDDAAIAIKRERLIATARKRISRNKAVAK